MRQFNPDYHHRRSIRLRGYDYRQVGTYFVTVCVQDRGCLLSDVILGEVQLSAADLMVGSIWAELPDHYPGVDIDAFVIMPNHIHGIIIMTVGAGPRACPAGEIGAQDFDSPTGQARGPAPTISLPEVVHRFKSLTTARYRRGVVEQGWKSFPGKLWQRNYYERIIRDEAELNRIREYIEYNPDNWGIDEDNPVVLGFQDPRPSYNG